MVDPCMLSSKNQEWCTPFDIFHDLNDEFHFELDAATTPDNPLGCKHFFTKEDDALTKEWKWTTFINPPFSIPEEFRKVKAKDRPSWVHPLKDWIKKSYETACKGHTVVMLIPSRTGNSWFHQYVYNKNTYKFRKGVTPRFLEHRITFRDAPSCSTFDSMVLVFDGEILGK